MNMSPEEFQARFEQVAVLAAELAAGAASATRLVALMLELGVDLVEPDELRQYLDESFARAARKAADVAERAKFGPGP